MRIHIVATIIFRPDVLDGAMALFEALVPAVRAEAGCLQYELYRANDNPAVFYMIEEWQDAGVLQRHAQAPHMQAFVAAVKDRLAQPLSVVTTSRVL